MKKIELKTINENGNVLLDYQTQIVQFLSTPLNPQAGANYDEMSKVLPLIDKVKNAGDGHHLMVEDAEHALIVERAKAARFTINRQEIFDMLRDIINAETVPAVGVRDAATQ